VNPGGISIAEFNFVDRNGNKRYDGPSELGTVRLRSGADSTPVDTNFKTPYTEEISGSFEGQLPGESSVRFTYVRKNVRDAGPYYVTNLVSAWVGKVTVPTVQTIGGERFNLLDVPDSIGSLTDVLFSNFPDGTY